MEDLELAAFVAVADTLHLGRAAAGLGVPRTTLSGRLRRLEARLGLILVDRSHRCRIALTQDGAALLPASRRAAEAAEALAARAAAVRTGRQGVVRVALAAAPDARVERLLRALRAVDAAWRVDVIAMDSRSALRAMVIGGVECVIADGPVPVVAGSGLTDRRANRHERRVAVGIAERRAGGLRAVWRRRWAEGARPGVPPHARVLETVALEMAHASRDARYPARVRIRWTLVSRGAALRREDELRRREERRLGRDAATARAAARNRRRELVRLWKGYVRGDPDVRAFVDGTRADGFDVGLGMDPSRPAVAVSRGSSAARRGR